MSRLLEVWLYEPIASNKINSQALLFTSVKQNMSIVLNCKNVQYAKNMCASPKLHSQDLKNDFIIPG